MKIKNKDRLVKRATEHKIRDRFISQYYIQEDGPDAVFEGCLIGCLAIPSNVAAAKRRVAELNGLEKFESWQVEDEDLLIAKLEEEFGICKGLQRVAEALLMTLPCESRARLGGFALTFAKVLPTDVDITDKLVLRWIGSRDVVYSNVAASMYDKDSYTHTGYEDFGGLVSLRDLSNEETGKERAAFLDWLRRGAPEPRVR